MEKIDVFDELYNELEPKFTTIDEVHTKGLWHQTFACWLVNKSNNSVVLQLRGPRNRIDPGSFDASASGHLSSGEKPEQGFRELEEELGVTIDKGDKHYLGMFRNIAIRGSYINHEFCHIYLASSNYSLKDFSLQEGEVDGVFEMDIDNAINMLLGKKDSIQIKGINENKDISTRDLCNYNERVNVTNYYLQVMLQAKAMLEGQENLAI